MASPVQFVGPLCARYICAIQVRVHILCDLIVGKLNEAVANRGSFDFVSN